jgi:hypothetical protein
LQHQQERGINKAEGKGKVGSSGSRKKQSQKQEEARKKQQQQRITVTRSGQESHNQQCNQLQQQQ